MKAHLPRTPRLFDWLVRAARRIGALCCLSLCLGITPAFPHANSVSYSNVTIDETGLTYNLLTYIHDLWQLVWLDSNNDGVIDDAEVRENREVILEYLREKIQVFEEDRVYEPELVRFESVVDTSFGFSQIVGVDLDFRYEKGTDWDGLLITCSLYDEVNYQHQSFAVITYGDKSEENH